MTAETSLMKKSPIRKMSEKVASLKTNLRKRLTAIDEGGFAYGDSPTAGRE